MELYSKLQCEVIGARDRARQLQHEAAERRLVQQLRISSPTHAGWRSRLAAQLHTLAEHLEPRTEPKESRL